MENGGDTNSTLYTPTPITSDSVSPSTSDHTETSLELTPFKPFTQDESCIEHVLRWMEHIECHHADLSGADKKKVLLEKFECDHLPLSDVVDLIAQIGKHGTRVNHNDEKSDESKESKESEHNNDKTTQTNEMVQASCLCIIA
jgi:hypothetical protein